MTDPFINAGFRAQPFLCDNCGTELECGDVVHLVGREYLCERCWEDAHGIDPW